MNFGILMKTIRTKKKWSQEELAEKIHMSRSAISKIENGEQSFGLETLAKLIQIIGEPGFGVSIICGVEGFSIIQNIIGFMGGG